MVLAAFLGTSCGGDDDAGTFCDNWTIMSDAGRSLTDQDLSAEERVGLLADIEEARDAILRDPPPGLEDAAAQFIRLQRAVQDNAPLPVFGDDNPIDELITYAADNCL